MFTPLDTKHLTGLICADEMKSKSGKNWIKFLGTAGARFVMLRQLRASGGIWVNFEGTNIIIDPGPGSLVKAANSRPRLDPAKLEAIVITHRHLDHVGDVNVMIEAMTEGGFKKRGLVFLPKDAVREDPIILAHTQKMPQKIIKLEQAKEYKIANLSLVISKRLIHPVETYGLNVYPVRKKISNGVYNKDKGFSLISDTAYFQGLEDNFKNNCLIINTVFFQSRPEVAHLSLPDVERIIVKMRPRLTILTHFGMTMLKHKPWIIAEELSKKLKLNVIAARDGQTLEID